MWTRWIWGQGSDEKVPGSLWEVYMESFKALVVYFVVNVDELGRRSVGDDG